MSEAKVFSTNFNSASRRHSHNKSWRNQMPQNQKNQLDQSTYFPKTFEDILKYHGLQAYLDQELIEEKEAKEFFRLKPTLFELIGEIAVDAAMGLKGIKTEKNNAEISFKDLAALDDNTLKDIKQWVNSHRISSDEVVKRVKAEITHSDDKKYPSEINYFPNTKTTI